MIGQKPSSKHRLGTVSVARKKGGDGGTLMGWGICDGAGSYPTPTAHTPIHMAYRIYH